MQRVIGRSRAPIGGSAVAAPGAKPEVKYEVADGIVIENPGKKSFTAYTDVGHEHYLTAQVADVNKALLSVKKIVSAGKRVVFDDAGSFIEDKTTGERMWLTERKSVYRLKLGIFKQSSVNSSSESLPFWEARLD